MTNRSQANEGERRAIELLAPAGEPESGYAALHYGADAIYLGLSRFSARAEAANFTPAEAGEIVAYAHSLVPRRRVFVTINTVVLNRELGQVVDLLEDVAESGADGVIVQDLGVARIVRQHFPELRMHASTQMAVHNVAGAEAVSDLGFARVTLARELTLEEVGTIVRGCSIETEAFIHGALCYSYSGLCFFSSLLRGGSGNRGRCRYPCRDWCHVAPPLHDGFAFSMKDLALLEGVKLLRAAGVRSLKIEGRMKSPLYVATVVNYYRRMLDGTLSDKDERKLAEDMRIVFARPWTRLNLRRRHAGDVVDAKVAGHRGAVIGSVLAVRRRGPRRVLQFKTDRRVEVRDGLQVEAPGQSEPFGFAVDGLRLVEDGAELGGRRVFVAPAGAIVEVVLPVDGPALPPGTPVCCSSSQAVKQQYVYGRPKAGAFRSCHAVDVELTVAPERVSVHAAIGPRHESGETVYVALDVEGALLPADQASGTEEAARRAFAKLGGTRFVLGAFECRNPGGLFVPASRLNDLRRRMVSTLEAAYTSATGLRVERIRTSVQGKRALSEAARSGPAWCVKVDRLACLSAFDDEDWARAAEVIVDIGREPEAVLDAGLAQFAAARGQDRIRLALPILARGAEEGALNSRISRMVADGWTRWQISNVSGLRMLGGLALADSRLDVSADWPLYALNRQAAQQLLDRGLTSFTLSPEDTRDNMLALLAEFGDRATLVVYQDVPVFLSDVCPKAALQGNCEGPKHCSREPMPMKLGGGESVLAVFDGCRTVVVNERPVCLAGRLGALETDGMVLRRRVDFVWRAYRPELAREIWRDLLEGRSRGGIVGNLDRGLA